MIECDYCNNKAEVVIIKVVQPSPPHPACQQCAKEMCKNGYVKTDFSVNNFIQLEEKRHK